MEDRNYRKKKKPYQGAIALMGTLLVLMLFSVVLLFLPQENEGGNKRPGNTPTPAPTEGVAREEECLAVFLELDKENRLLTVYDVKEEEQRKLVYTGATLFYDSYGIQQTAGQLVPGELYSFLSNTETESLIHGKVAVDRSENREEGGVWEKSGIDSLSIARDSKKLSFRNQNYRYGDGLCVMSNGKQISIDEIDTKRDIVTVRGLGQTAYEIVVTKGHGTIALKNFEDFVGGTIAIGSTWVDTVSSEGTYVIREGEYALSVVKGKYFANISVTVERDKTVEVDLFDYGRGPIQTGKLKFLVDPLGATLYIDGVKTYYTDGVELDYGVYRIQMTEGGYISYEATITVDQPEQTISVYLKESPVEEGTEEDGSEEGTDTTETGTEDAGDSGSSDTDAGSDTEDYFVSVKNMGFTVSKSNKVYLLTPVGAQVHINGQYLGEAPLSFEKILGIYQLRLTDETGKAKDFICTGTENGKDDHYTFSLDD